VSRDAAADPGCSRLSEDAVEEAEALLTQGSLAVAERVYQPHLFE
jgi:hypothetical protein